MARQTGWALALLLTVGTTISATPARQSEPQQPRPSKPADEKHARGQRGPQLWWHDEKVKVEVGLRADQVVELDRVFRAYWDKALPLRKEVMELDKNIEKMITSNSPDMQLFTQQVKRVEARRSELNEMRTVMLYSIRRVLTADQNSRFQAWWDRREAAKKKQDGDRRK